MRNNKIIMSLIFAMLVIPNLPANTNNTEDGDLVIAIEEEGVASSNIKELLDENKFTIIGVGSGLIVGAIIAGVTTYFKTGRKYRRIKKIDPQDLGYEEDPTDNFMGKLSADSELELSDEQKKKIQKHLNKFLNEE